MIALLTTESPFTMEVLEAPDPEDVFWSNVGRKHKFLQLGMLFSLGISVATCLLWTIPVSFVASLSSVGALRAEVPALDSVLDALPFLVPVFEVLAPQFLVILNALLPTVSDSEFVIYIYIYIYMLGSVTQSRVYFPPLLVDAWICDNF